MDDKLIQNPDFPTLEKDILAYWKKNKIFEKSIQFRSKDKKWTFLDGPPFVTGMPHYGHLLGSIHKDIFGRYFTMKGFRVRRVWGWDGHGLPIENKVENALKIKRKKDIEEKIGVKKFVEACKTYVNQISNEWEWYVDHIGRWVDFKNAYKTWDTPYMESVMWVFNQMYTKGFVYKGLRVSLYCPHCATPISNFEVAMDNENYRDITEVATTYKYKLTEKNNTYLLAWSTTPWTKLVTPALAINPALPYVEVTQGKNTYIVTKNRLEMIKGKYTIKREFQGTELVGKKFEPHYDFYNIDEGKQAYVVVPADYVTDTDGTGIVTLAAYGEEDLSTMKKHNIQLATHLDEEGVIQKSVPHFGGIFYLDANVLIDADLEKRSLIYHHETITHSMPHCWRCATQLYYAPQNAWYVDVQKLKPLMKKTNESINWYPSHFKHGRFLKSMESAPDWCISRNRYWGSPVPVWECECGERFVPDSIKTLEKRSNQTITDLHRPEIDDVTVKCTKCGKTSYRVKEVLDSWTEAGSASFAERHFPFDFQKGKPYQNEKLEDFFPPDFIAEYTGQIRAWFYVLHVIGAILYKSPAYKNVGVEGVILGTDGRKMSKNFGNYPDPKEMLDKLGGDALRLYLCGSPVMNGEDLILSSADYASYIRTFHLPLWNIVNFFITYSTIDGFTDFNLTESETIAQKSENILDVWILALLNEMILDVTTFLEIYNTQDAIKKIITFIDDLSKWYVRRSRGRSGENAEEKDRVELYHTLFTILITLFKVIAPIAPFLSEYLFRFLTKKESVHLEDWPKTLNTKSAQILTDMDKIRKIVEVAHRFRKDAQIKLRQPLGEAIITVLKKDVIVHNDAYEELLKAELNVKKITWKEATTGEITVSYDMTITPALQAEGEARELVRAIQGERKKMNLLPSDKINVKAPHIPHDWETFIIKTAGIVLLKQGESFIVEKV